MPIARLLILAMISGLGAVAVGAGLAQDMEVFDPPPDPNRPADTDRINRIPTQDGAGESETEETPEEPVPEGCIRLFGEISCPQEEPAAAAVLLREGPQTSWNMAEGRFSVQGLVRNGWPVAIDFQPEPNTRTVLRVTLFERGFFARGPRVDLLLDADGLAGRRLVVLDNIELPDDPAVSAMGVPVRVATFLVRSRRLRPDGRESDQRAPVQVFGIGVGPRAVGSLTLTDLMLANGAPSVRLSRPGPLRIDYGFQLRQRFVLVRAELLRDCRRVFCNRVAASVELNNGFGRLGGKAPIRRPGSYRLSVRAWMDCDAVEFRQCADQPAWTAGGAGPLLVEQ